MPGVPLYDASSNDMDAVNAAALDNRTPDYSKLPTMDSVLVDTDKLVKEASAAANQQHPDTSFINASDVLSAITLGAGAVLTGGLSLAQGLGIGLLGAGGASSERRQAAAQGRQKTSEGYVNTAVDVLKTESANVTQNNRALSNEAVARLQASPEFSPRKGTSLESAKSLLFDTAMSGTEDEYNKLQRDLSQAYSSLGNISYATARNITRNRATVKNFGGTMKLAATLIEQGNPEGAQDLVGTMYASMLPQGTPNIFSGDSGRIILDKVVRNSDMTSSDKKSLMNSLQMLRLSDEAGFNELVNDLDAMQGPLDTYRDKVRARVETTLDAARNADPAVLGFARMILARDADPNASIWGSPEGDNMIDAMMPYVMRELAKLNGGSTSGSASAGTTGAATPQDAEVTSIDRNFNPEEFLTTIPPEAVNYYKNIFKAVDTAIKNNSALQNATLYDTSAPAVKQILMASIRGELAGTTEANMINDPGVQQQILDYAMSLVKNGGSSSGQPK